MKNFYKSARISIIVLFIILLLVVGIVIYWVFSKESAPEVTPPAGEVKSITLTLVPVAATSDSLITPSVSCLPDCNGKTVFIKEYSTVPCAGNQISSCVISGSDCTGFVFAAPSQSGVHGYVACIDRNGNNNFNDGGESSKPASLVVISQ